MAATQTTPLSAGRIAFTYPSFVLYQIARLCVVLATEMQSVAIGWQVYEITKRPLDLGLVGIVQFLPGILLFLISGHAADRYDRRKLLILCHSGFAACSALFFLIALRGAHSVAPIYGALLLLGVVRAFTGPVSRAILPQLVSEEHFPNAVAWNSTTFQCSVILGPSLGGIIYALFRGPSAVYALGFVVSFVAAVASVKIKPRSQARRRGSMSLDSVLAGFRYIWKNKLILGSISLDLFAVLLGGAVALLPVYAREILMTGPWGLGILRSAPAVGAGLMAIYLAHNPLRRRVGATMLFCVAGFGLFTVLFGISRSLTLSLIALVFVGASDMVSVIVRSTLVQVATPDEMRGRVNAVDMIFVGASNQVGQFESGITAQWFGTVPAVVLGGIGTLLVTAAWAWCFPELRNADRLIAESGSHT